MPREEKNGSPLKLAIDECNNLIETEGVVQKGNKKYLEVKHRVQVFRKFFPLWGIQTTLLYADEKYVRVQATITNPTGAIIGSGMAEEVRGVGMVNKTSALENGETSAVGRALAAIGLGGSEYASVNELDAVGRKDIALKQHKANEREVKKKEAENKPAPKTETVTWSFDKTPTEWVDQAITAVKGCEDMKEIGAWQKLGEEEMVVLEKAEPGEYQRLVTAVNKVVVKLRKP